MTFQQGTEEGDRVSREDIKETTSSDAPDGACHGLGSQGLALVSQARGRKAAEQLRPGEA